MFNIVFYPHSTFSLFFSTGKSRTCDTSTTGQNPVSSQPDQNKQLSTRFLNTRLPGLKFYKLFNSYRIGISASSLRQTKITTNCIKNTMPDITEHYPRIKLHSPSINTERTPAFDWRKFLFQIQGERWTTTHIPPNRARSHYQSNTNSSSLILEVLTDQNKTKAYKLSLTPNSCPINNSFIFIYIV